MKIILTVILLLIGVCVWAQRSTIIWNGEKVKIENRTNFTEGKICLERGHIIDFSKRRNIKIHKMIKFVDYPDSTVMIDYRKASTTQYRCIRCRQWITMTDEPERITILPYKYETTN